MPDAHDEAPLLQSHVEGLVCMNVRPILGSAAMNPDLHREGAVAFDKEIHCF
jgi:hypothetical protein